MKTEIKIIKALIESKEMTIRQISKKINADYKITHIAIQRLIEKKIITVKTIGNSSLCRLNNSHYSIEIYEAEDERRKVILKNNNINQLLKEIMNKIGTSLFILLIFGSYVKKEQTKKSDIDLMFISKDSGFEDKVHGIISLIPFKVHPLIFSEKEFKMMLYSRESNVVKEAMDNYIILYGAENFYRLKNA